MIFVSLVSTNNKIKQTMVAFALISNFQVRLPAGELNLIVQIRDTLDCVTEVNLTLSVTLDEMDFINSLENLENNSMARLLVSGNQNTVGQIINSITQQSNQKNDANLNKAISSK